MELERFCVIDVETTGLRPATDRIVEIACALVDGERVVGRWATLVNPKMAIPPSATAVHGITDEMVARAPDAESALQRAGRLCRGRVMAAHCAGFDLAFVGAAVAAEALCTMRLARALIPEAPNHKNQTLRWFLGVDRVAGGGLRAHRALGDALVTAYILIACRRRFRVRRPLESWERFVRGNALVPGEGTASRSV
ncbi:MAG TPA: 3'-5' exonuclease [Candidatus Babeliales bacterium]|nr:3'-5' exonuclease [Candidatus Babeliales bacterium]